MSFGPLIFLAAFLALSFSWFGFVLKPQFQIGRMQQTNTLISALRYPSQRPGLAAQGLQVYRSEGCAWCHTQQARQDRTVFDVMLQEEGTNQNEVVGALKAFERISGSRKPIDTDFSSLPRRVLRTGLKMEAEALARALGTNGAKTSITITPIGADIERGWAKRRSVAEDFLYDMPVMPGSQRVGPDLAHVGGRLPNPNWQLRHLYAPTAEVKGSTMPPYRYLFEVRKARGSPDALALGSSFVPAGYEVVPKREAVALVAYLLSLRADAALFSAPLTVATAAPPPAGTNATSIASATNSTPATAPGNDASAPK